ncbi:MAG: hypothetical protein ACRCYO_01670, partial [Bacteroidia bacterium]
MSVENAKRFMEIAKKNNVVEYDPNRLIEFSNGNRFYLSLRENRDTLLQQRRDDSLRAMEPLFDEIKGSIDWGFITDSTYSYAVFENRPNGSGLVDGVVYYHSPREQEIVMKLYQDY